MRKHARFLYQPVIPLGKNRTFVTGSKAHLAISAETVTEGTVLLKNNGALPLKNCSRISLFGRGAGSGFLFGGGGSGRLQTSGRVNLAEGLERNDVAVFRPLIDFYSAYVDAEAAQMEASPNPVYLHWLRGHERPEPAVPGDLYEQAKEFSDTAVYCISRFSSEGSDYGDRYAGKGEFQLSDVECELLEKLTRDFKTVIVVLNVCGPIEMGLLKENDKIDAVLYPLYGGHLAGQILAEILLGKRYPSGHLQDTIARTIDDYPTTATFCESRDFVNYTEDIFVGYRYFETFAPEKVLYPFGFGMSYTNFEVATVDAALEKNSVKLTVHVKNTGEFKGKEVIQAYLTAPQGKLGKAKKVLCAFAKTKELQPGEETNLKLSFDIREFGSFDDLGKIKKSAFLLEAGRYVVSVGTNVRDTAACLEFYLEKEIICRQCKPYMAPVALPERLTADGSYEKLPAEKPIAHKPKRYKLTQPTPNHDISLEEALQNGQLDAFIASLTDEDLASLLYGHPDFNAADTNGIGLTRKERRDVKKIPLIPTADGPAGFRVFPDSGIDATHFPCGNTIAQTWNLELARKIGAAGAREVKENNAGIWLSPALNIHRNPLCGRNYEYYSEDPLCSGLFAAWNVKGVQSQNIAATVKHYLANNKEINRKASDSRVSQRALREIYLRSFEIVVKKARPWALMTSYNLINGVPASANWESINGILRGEWGFDGVVMTDWWTHTNVEEELAAGSDVKMPEHITFTWDEAPAPYPLVESFYNGKLDKATAYAAVRRIFAMMGKFD